MIARQHQMVAVVDGHAEDGVVIGAAASAGERRRFVHDDGFAAQRELDRGGKAGETGADDVDGPRHQMNAYRKMIQSSRARDTLTRSRGALHPRATMPSRIMR